MLEIKTLDVRHISLWRPLCSAGDPHGSPDGGRCVLDQVQRLGYRQIGENWHWEHGFASSGPRAISRQPRTMQRSCTRMTGPASDSNVWLHWSQPVAFGDGELRRENLMIAMGVWDVHPADLLDVGRCSCIDFFVALSTLASWVPQVRRIHDAANHCCRSLCLKNVTCRFPSFKFCNVVDDTSGTHCWNPDPEMVLVITRGSSHFCV